MHVPPRKLRLRFVAITDIKQLSDLRLGNLHLGGSRGQ